MQTCGARISPGGRDAPVESPQRDPVGNQPHPVKADHQPETSLASSSVMAARSVDSEYRSHDIEPRNHAISWSLRRHVSGGSTEAPEWSGVDVRPGSKNVADV